VVLIHPLSGSKSLALSFDFLSNVVLIHRERSTHYSGQGFDFLSNVVLIHPIVAIENDGHVLISSRTWC